MTFLVLAAQHYRVLLRPVKRAFPQQARRVAPAQVGFRLTRYGGDQIVDGSAAELARFRSGSRRNTTDLSLASGKSDPCNFPWVRTSNQEHARCNPNRDQTDDSPQLHWFILRRPRQALPPARPNGSIGDGADRLPDLAAEEPTVAQALLVVLTFGRTALAASTFIPLTSFMRSRIDERWGLRLSAPAEIDRLGVVVFVETGSERSIQLAKD